MSIYRHVNMAVCECECRWIIWLVGPCSGMHDVSLYLLLSYPVCHQSRGFYTFCSQCLSQVQKQPPQPHVKAFASANANTWPSIGVILYTKKLQLVNWANDIVIGNYTLSSIPSVWWRMWWALLTWLYTLLSFSFLSSLKVAFTRWRSD